MTLPPRTDSAEFSRLNLTEAAALLAQQKLPPVDQWHPADCSDSHMEIRADGSWWHQGSPILRPALVRLFASILRREADGSYVLVTPHEKQRIAVVDMPFRAVEMISEGRGADRQLMFRLGNDDLVRADAAHPLRLVDGKGEPDAAVHVRGAIGLGLEARVTRSLYYELVEMALADGGNPPALWSGGLRFGWPD